MKSRLLSLSVFIAISATLSACSPSGGPSAHVEADQATTTAHATAQEWAREDLITRSTTGNIKMPAPGLIIQALSDIQETAAPPNGEEFPIYFAEKQLRDKPPSDWVIDDLVNTALFPTYAAVEKQKADFFSQSDFAAQVARLSKMPDPAKGWEDSVGPLVASLSWKGMQDGNIQEAREGLVRARFALSAAAWCRTATQSIKGWPIDAMSHEKKEYAAMDVYVQITQQTVISCANLVAKISADLGPVAYADQNGLKMAVYKRLAAFQPAEIEAFEEKADAKSVSLDFGSFQGQAFNTTRGRFENTGSGWTWQTGNLAYLDGGHVFGREVTIDLANAATGTQRRAITGTQTISAEAVQRAKAAVQSGNPAAGSG